MAIEVQIIEQVKQKISWEEAISRGMVARESEDNGRWALGDLANEVEKDYGKDSIGKYAYAIGVARKTLMGYRTVASKFDMPIRIKYQKLSFSHFKTCCSLEKPEAWLEKADDDNWSVEHLSKEISKAYEGLIAPDLTDKPPRVERCPECGLWRLIDISNLEICRGHYKIEKNRMIYK
jgi:hypothetical protein